jgi:predicted type IV restriction endonuclease
MAHYRAYLLGSDGHIWKVVDLVKSGDVEAIEAAKQLVDGHDVELWERDRRVACLKSETLFVVLPSEPSLTHLEGDDRTRRRPSR